jgi:hypothetical protein
VRDRGWDGSIVCEVFFLADRVLVKSETVEDVVSWRYICTFGLEGGRFLLPWPIIVNIW